MCANEQSTSEYWANVTNTFENSTTGILELEYVCRYHYLLSISFRLRFYLFFMILDIFLALFDSSPFQYIHIHNISVDDGRWLSVVSFRLHPLHLSQIDSPALQFRSKWLRRERERKILSQRLKRVVISLIVCGSFDFQFSVFNWFEIQSHRLLYAQTHIYLIEMGRQIQTVCLHIFLAFSCFLLCNNNFITRNSNR